MSAPVLRVPQPGETLAGKYRLLAVLGRGGMGVVFDGYHELLDRRVAIKVLAPEVLGSQEAVTRFLNEARAAARISSERVVHVLDVGLLDGGLPFMVMERLEGVDLAKFAEQQGRLEVSDVVDLVVEGIEGVAHAHLEGIIHRDLKPSNLFLAQRPDRTTVVKVLDFGISKIASPDGASGSVTSTRAVLGSPLYMSPEQLRSAKSIDVRADIWSLGVILYELLTGRVPFDGDNVVAIFAAIAERPVRPLPELRPDVPLLLDQIVRRCLERAAEARFQNVFALAGALAPFGSRRAQASVSRLAAHVSSRGLAFEELSSTVPRFDAASPQPQGERASRPSSAATPATLPSAPPPAPLALSVPPTGKPAGATSATWASTRGGGSRRRAPAKWLLAAGAITVVGIASAVVYRARSTSVVSGAQGLVSGASLAAPSASPVPSEAVAVAPSSAPRPAPPATGTATIVPDPTPAAPIAKLSHAARPPASPLVATPSPSPSDASSPSTAPSPPPPPPAPPKPAANPNPLTMKPM